MNEEIKKPSLFLHLSESFRAIYELIKGLYFVAVFPYKNIGNGQIILVIPGLLSSDLATSLLRKFLSKLGYQAFGWEMGRNLGRLNNIELLVKKVERMTTEHQQKIILIGWSMGGIFAREIAKSVPSLIQKVITIGSPFANVLAPNNAKWVFNLLNNEATIDPQFLEQVSVSAPVHTTALYSKTDGIVPWQACMETGDDLHKNIEVHSSHFGMGMNPEVMKVLVKILPKN